MARSGLTCSLQTCWRAPARTSRTRWRGRGWRAARPPRPTPGREVRHSPGRGPRPSPRGTGSPSRSPAPAPACPSPPPSSWWGERGHTWALPGSTLQPPRQAEAVPALRLRAQSSPGSSPSSPRPPSCTAPPPSSRAAPPWPWRRRPRCRWSSVSWVVASPSWRRSNTCQSASSWRCWWGRSRPWPPPGRSCPAWTSPASCRGCSRSRPGGPAASSTWCCRRCSRHRTNSWRSLCAGKFDKITWGGRNSTHPASSSWENLVQNPTQSSSSEEILARMFSRSSFAILNRIFSCCDGPPPAGWILNIITCYNWGLTGGSFHYRVVIDILMILFIYDIYDTTVLYTLMRTIPGQAEWQCLVPIRCWPAGWLNISGDRAVKCSLDRSEWSVWIFMTQSCLEYSIRDSACIKNTYPYSHIRSG